ncbi:glycerate kinase type-2 family protein [Flavihumibacter fluvii]|uniref:glycerate kinase type-2 family protein n=1 Tax=Flavihumibacter fluvii TaxID=2838157 RepID=UPI001BDF51A1|nr:DUF4147 domain-containing protein [Flavihumibacter fluvii]ULQ53147.1 DUF4147 domain-containing protein [Flavihumibacter fluvii]
MTNREKAIQIFNSAVAAVQPERLIPDHLKVSGNTLQVFDQQLDLARVDGVYVIGAGKASAAMAQSVERILGGYLTGGIVVTKYDHCLPLQTIVCREAGHPVPDEQAVAATAEMISLIQHAGENAVIICLISGGASSLWIDLPNGISLNDIQYLFQLLLKSGATIDEVNTVRKHLSTIKGGQLLRFAPGAKWFSLVISDVPGDDVSVIASGPTAPDDSSFFDVNNILLKYKLKDKLPEAVSMHLENGLHGIIADTPKSDDPIFKQVRQKIIGNNKIALDAAAAKARELGCVNIHINTKLSGDAAVIGQEMVREIEEYTGGLPVCFLAGGETTVEVSGNGKGGRNQHLVLSALCVSGGIRNFTLLAAGTDGTDGPTDAAGAIIDNTLLSTINDRQLNPEIYLRNHDAYHFFEQVGALFKTGATQTNVMDLVIGIIN